MATFQEKLTNATQGANIKTASLRFLSDMASADRSTFRDAWPPVPVTLRRKIVADLVILAEDNIDLNFRHVFLTALEDPDPQVRLTAVEGLYEDESKLLLNKLLPMLRQDPDLAVREAVAKAMGRFTYLAHCEKPVAPRDRIRAALIESATDDMEDDDVKRRSVEALGYFHGDHEVQELIAEAYHEGGTYAESAVFAMGCSMDDRWAPTVLEELHNDSAPMRYEAARAAGEMLLEDALVDLVRMTEDTDIEVTLAAVWSLGQIGGKAASQALGHVLKSENPALREAAQEALEELLFNADPLNAAPQLARPKQLPESLN